MLVFGQFKSHFEAAEIDGAGRLQILREIILPALKPTTVFLVIISTIGFLRIFDQVTQCQQIVPGDLLVTKPLVLMIYEFAFDEFKLRASALTVILFLLLLFVSLLQLWLARDQYEKNDQIIERLDNINPQRFLLGLLLFIGGVMVTPIIFMVSTSLKTGQEVYTLSLIPKSPLHLKIISSL